MATPTGAAVPAFVARTQELERVRALLDAAADGRMGALLVSGDAGVGKTRLLQRAGDEATTDAATSSGELVVLTGACLPMGATTAPLLPLRTALRRLPPGLQAPSLGAADGETPFVVDEWLERTCAEHPVALVVDDVQWADPASLDVLTYLLAGPSDRRLAVLMTLRRGEVGPGHPVHRWLADVRRMPSLTELGLGAFDRGGTREQLHALLGASPHESLVTDVHARTGGNAYLNRLLVEGLPSEARHLDPGMPEDLRGAVLRSWHRLAVEARELVLAVAIGGEVAGGAALDRAVDLAGTAPVDAPRLLREAVDADILDASPDGYWFHHPLQAEALDSLLTGEERRRLHAAFARLCEDDLGTTADAPTPGNLAATAAVAEHHLRAGHHLEAYRWTLRAADLADRLGDEQARLSLLGRLVELRDRVDGVEESRVLLLSRLRETAAALGEHETEHGAAQSLLAEVDEADDPLLVAELLVRQEHLRFSTGRGFIRLEPVRRAATLSAPWPDSWQHGYALAEVAHASLWADDPGAQVAVAAAVARADATGHPRSTAYAYAAAGMGAEFAGCPGGGALAARGVAAAAEARDWWGFVHAALWEANGTATTLSAQWSLITQGRRHQLAELGGPHPYLAWMSSTEAMSLLHVGNWRECADRLRVALGADPGVGADVAARLVAAHLATLQGRQREAEDHLARADELFTETSGFLPFEFDAVRALVRLGAGDPGGAYQAALAGVSSPGAPPTLCEWLCPLAARALADFAASARESGGSDDLVSAQLTDLVARFPHAIADKGVARPEYLAIREALDALYAAEVARGRRDADETTRWRVAAGLLDGVLPWDAAYATARAGESVLVRGGGSREEAAALLRHAYSLALELEAEPVLREVVALARTARIPLDDVAAPSAAPGGDRRLPGLTAREREVLDHVIAGRTYGEIARDLYVSEKTVSSHVSNLLRKTGAANRVELAQLARHAADGSV
ncbi:MAG TPA: AAA family ATPase [Ornithinibacter sp.]|nr:AAA family ATPase [Ornithinibacter sp.]